MFVINFNIGIFNGAFEVVDRLWNVRLGTQDYHPTHAEEPGKESRDG